MSKSLFTAVLVTFCIATAAGPVFTVGQHYELVTPAQPTSSGEKIEVIELFWIVTVLGSKNG